MNVRALKAGLQVAEVPSFEHKRRYGTSGLKTFRDGWRVLKIVLKERFSPFPARRPSAGRTRLRSQVGLASTLRAALAAVTQVGQSARRPW